MSQPLAWKTRAFALLIVLSNSFGNLLVALGMRASPDVSAAPLEIIRAILQPQVFLGIVLLILWMLMRMALLSWADLTYVVPVTAVGYVISAVLGRLFLNEQISAARWAGTILIVGGTILVGLGPERKR